MKERDTLKEHLSRAGAIGGRKKGKAKVRGDAKHYRKLSALAQEARRQNKKASEAGK